MKLLFIVSVQLYFLILLFSYCQAAPSKGSKRPPSFHLGRSFPWLADPELREEAKRFPKFLRTGRSGFSPLLADEDDARNDNNMKTTGMWFGPRMGRLQKRDSGYQENPWAYVIFGENPATRQVHYTPRLGRESEENLEDEAEAA